MQFTDVPVPEGYELAAVGFSASWEDPEEFVGVLPTFRQGQGASHYKELSLHLLFESHETDSWGYREEQEVSVGKALPESEAADEDATPS